MTFQPYVGAALCFEASRLQLYQDACLVAYERGNSWQYAGRQFNCKGILMARFYEYLVSGGEVNQCVCRFTNTGSGLVFSGHWGPCNGACVAKSYTCNGRRPVPHNGQVKEVNSHVAMEEKEAKGDESGVMALRVGWKLAGCVGIVAMFNILA
jgi:hypothetical protein